MDSLGSFRRVLFDEFLEIIVEVVFVLMVVKFVDDHGGFFGVFMSYIMDRTRLRLRFENQWVPIVLVLCLHFVQHIEL